jgi:anti-anti-sigma factor
MDTDGADEFQKHLDKITVDEGEPVEIDMAQLTFIGSAGIGKMISFLKKVTANGGSVSVTNLSSDLQTLFRVMRLDRIFNIDSL